MTSPIPTSDAVLRLCAALDPNPWFPSQYAQDTGTVRDSLDEPLNQLRLAGLLRIGGWEAGRGQCYLLTDAGRAAAADTRKLAQLLGGKISAPIETPAARPERMTAWDRGEAVRAAFSADGRRPPVLFAVIAAQVIVFVAGLLIVLRHDAPVGVYLERGLMPVRVFGAIQTVASPMEPLVLIVQDLARGEWWRLLTYALVHFGALHLFMNLYGHVALGGLVERMYGSPRFLVLYLLSALGGGVAVALLSGDGAATAGSSGALCGLIGGFAGFVLLNRGHLGRDLFDHCRRWLGNTVVILILFSLLPGVSWQGHLGGFVAGLVAGVLLTYHRFGTAEQRWAALLGLILLPIAGVAPLVEKGILHLQRPAGISVPHGAKDRREPTDASGSIRRDRSLSRW